jgi:hypothetical protein
MIDDQGSQPSRHRHSSLPPYVQTRLWQPSLPAPLCFSPTPSLVTMRSYVHKPRYIPIYVNRLKDAIFSHTKKNIADQNSPEMQTKQMHKNRITLLLFTVAFTVRTRWRPHLEHTDLSCIYIFAASLRRTYVEAVEWAHVVTSRWHF